MKDKNQSCADCNKGYKLVGDKCVPYSDKCPNGKPYTSERITDDQCKSCNTGYRLVKDINKPNHDYSLTDKLKDETICKTNKCKCVKNDCQCKSSTNPNISIGKPTATCDWKSSKNAKWKILYTILQIL